MNHSPDKTDTEANKRNEHERQDQRATRDQRNRFRHPGIGLRDDITSLTNDSGHRSSSRRETPSFL